MKTKTARKRPRREIVDEVAIENMLKSINEVKSFNLKRCHKLYPKHQEFLKLIQAEKTNMIFVNGPAGTAKTYIAVYGALSLLKEERCEEIIYIRSIVESSSRSIGALPGEIGEKFQPYAMPLVEKMNEIIDKRTIDRLFESSLVRAIPVNFVRGLTFNKAVVIIDEAQNLTKKELVTILTRFGNKSLYIVCGDVFQSDIKDSGYKDIVNAFCSDKSVAHEIHCINFTKNEIVRSEILKYIVKVLEGDQSEEKRYTPEPIGVEPRDFRSSGSHEEFRLDS